MGKKKKNAKEYITLNIECKPDKKFEQFLFKNCGYRHYLYNKGVEYIKQYQDKHGFILTDKYIINEYLRITVEKIDKKVRPDYIKDYNYYFMGIRAKVAEDLSKTSTLIRNKRKCGIPSDIKFQKFDKNHQSFKFENKMDKNTMNERGLCYGNRLMLFNDNPYLIGFKINRLYSKKKIYGGVIIKENIFKLFYKYNLNVNDVDEIRFVFHNDKWHVQLICEFSEQYECCRKNAKKIFSSLRQYGAGIDCGFKNPVTIYDGQLIQLPKELMYPKSQIDKYNRKIKNCQRVMDRKYNKSMDEFHQSHNYYRTLAKFHKYLERKKNIIKDWHYKLALWIVSHYKNIVVDEVHDYLLTKKDEVIQSVRKTLNRVMKDKAMGYFQIRLHHMSNKYGTNYFIMTEISNNKCPVCFNINDIKMGFDKITYKRDEIFKCTQCGYTQYRDINAAMNCYNYLMT